ncbi:hypothetical protein Taro_050499, partial [Colocasia esculenta]|nr:hypothetical protein [Colocasia esculenta]
TLADSSTAINGASEHCLRLARDRDLIHLFPPPPCARQQPLRRCAKLLPTRSSTGRRTAAAAAAASSSSPALASGSLLQRRLRVVGVTTVSAVAGATLGTGLCERRGGKEIVTGFLSSFVFFYVDPFQNVNEDTDEMFDELFDKFGKVVYKRGDRKPPSAEADDDAESLSFAVALAKVANDVKAADVRVLFVKPLVYWTRFFIIATAFSRPQIDAIGSRIRDLAEKQFRKVPRGDSKPNSWTLLDFGDVVVHIFLPQQRAFYNLEEFYGNATSIELPFDSQPPFGS